MQDECTSEGFRMLVMPFWCVCKPAMPPREWGCFARKRKRRINFSLNNGTPTERMSRETLCRDTLCRET